MSARQQTSAGVVTVFLISPAIAHTIGAGLTLSAAGQNGSDAATVTLPKSLVLHALADANGSAPVSIDLTVLSSESALLLESAEGTGPALASQPVSISIYDAKGAELKVDNLAEPVQVILQSVATEDAKCAYWDEVASAWSDKGMTRVSDASLPSALICNTTHLTIFAAVVGEFASAFNDMASVLTCSNAQALLSPTAFSSVINSSRWKHSLPAGLLGASIAVSFLALAIARVADFMTKQQLPEKDRILLAENSHIHNAAEQDEAPSMGPALAIKRQCSRCYYVMLNILSWMGLVPNSIKTLLQDNVPLVLLPEAFISSNVRKVQALRAKVDEETLDLVVKANAGVATMSAQPRPSFQRAMTKLSDEAQAGDVASAAQAFLEAGCLRRVVLILQAVHPWTTFRHVSAFSSHTARVAIFTLRLFISMTAAVIFYDAEGSALSPDSDPQCAPRAGLFAELVRATTVGIASNVVASRIADVLERLRRRQVVNKDEWAIDAQRWQHLVWHLKADLFWLLWSGCLAFCALLIAVFIANVDEASASGWLQSTAVSLFDELVLYPVVYAAFVAVVTSILLCCRAGLKQELLRSGTETGDADRALEDDAQELPTLITALKQQNDKCENVVIEEIHDNSAWQQAQDGDFSSMSSKLSSVMPVSTIS